MAQPQQQINIQLGEQEAEGIYSNLALITHSGAEFVIDFTRIVPGMPRAKVYARILMTPQHAKSFMNAMQENIEKYEKQFGEIKIHGDTRQKNFGFVAEPKQQTNQKK
jgi:hypothetical protein